MDYEEQFSDNELGQIIEQGLIYMCACPAQVAEGVRKLRETYRYQKSCLSDPVNDAKVHKTIEASVVRAHAILQECLSEVLVLEQWDLSTLQMPEGLRTRQMRELLPGN
jgi:hypothetical protein